MSPRRSLPAYSGASRPSWVVCQHFWMNGLYRSKGCSPIMVRPGCIHCRTWLMSAHKFGVRPPQRGSIASYIVPVQLGDGSPAMLKCGLPSNPEFVAEALALQCFDGRGAVRLLEVDLQKGIMMIERASPGQPLSVLEDDDQTTRMAAVLMQRLWRAAPECEDLPSLTKWSSGFGRMRERFNGETGPLSEALVERAEKLYAELISSTASPMLLHGDLHHDNIVSARREAWLALDPKGVTGDPAFEPAALLYNPIPAIQSASDAKSILERRIEILADVLGFRRQRIRNWAFAQGMLSAWWCIEDGVGDWEYWQRVAGLLV
jgi:streptomycin 6-kinase